MEKCLICDSDINEYGDAGDFDGFHICRNCELNIRWQEQGFYDSVVYIDIDILLKVINRLQTKIDYLENKINILEGTSNGK